MEDPPGLQITDSHNTENKKESILTSINNFTRHPSTPDPTHLPRLWLPIHCIAEFCDSRSQRVSMQTSSCRKVLLAAVQHFA